MDSIAERVARNKLRLDCTRLGCSTAYIGMFSAEMLARHMAQPHYTPETKATMTVVCPRCTYRWLAGIYACPRCGTTLVE